jgi:Glycosyl transferase family 2
MTEPKITVIIPTRERSDVLQKALATVTAQDYEALEIIVSDNGSRDGTADVVRAVDDRRIRYLNTGRRLSMSHNWEFALSHVQDGWVTILGDDDGLLPRTLRRVAEIIRSTDVQAIRTLTCSYLWPSLTGLSFGRMYVPRRGRSEVRSAAQWLGKVLRGQASYPDLPMLYSGGYVHVSVLERIRERMGAFYHSCIPDVYSAVAIASTIDRYLFVHEPLAINGASRHSTGTSQFTSARTGRKGPADLFASEPNIPFHPGVPLLDDGGYPPSLQALTYEAYLQTVSLRAHGSPSTTAAEQLKVILSEPGKQEMPLKTWSRKFAALHGLDLAAAERRALPMKLRRRARAVRRRVVGALSLKRLGSPEQPIRDVHEASVAAGPVLLDSDRR